jgi:hypothetical protein
MIGGMKVTPWRQTNAVTPAVTATQTGAGTHNGMALTVKVLTGADILSRGDGSYDYGLVPGASGSANANAPAKVTLTPVGTGSVMFGAVNKNNASAAWTPVSGTTFIQNVADATNGATYGTFTGGTTSVTMIGTPSAPVQVLGVTGTSTNTVTGAWDPTQPRTTGHLLVAVVTAYGTTTAGTITEGSGTWTKGPDVVATNRARTTIWTLTALGKDTAPSFTATNTGTAARALLVCELIELAGQDPVTPIATQGTNTGTSGTLTVTTTTNGGNVPAVGCYAISGWNIISASGAMAWTKGAAWTNLDSTGATATYSHAAYDYYQSPPAGSALAEIGTHDVTSTYQSGAIIVVQPQALVVPVKHIQNQQNYVTVGTTCPVTITSTGGNTLVASIVVTLPADTPTMAIAAIADSTGTNTWQFSTAAQSQTPPAAGAWDAAHTGYFFSAIGYCVNAAAVTSVTVTSGASVNSGSMRVIVSEFSGIPATATAGPAAADTTLQTGTTLTSPAVTTTGFKDLIVAATEPLNFWTAADSPWTLAWSSGEAAWLISTSPGTDAATWTNPVGGTNTTCNSCILTITSPGSSGSIAGTPLAVGSSDGDGASGANGGIAVYEVMAAGMLTEDPSAPAPVSTTSAKSVTTAHFTPPMGSLLVAKVATAGTAVGVQVTDDNGYLEWYEQAKWASGTSGYAGVWTAIVTCG